MNATCWVSWKIVIETPYQYLTSNNVQAYIHSYNFLDPHKDQCQWLTMFVIINSVVAMIKITSNNTITRLGLISDVTRQIVENSFMFCVWIYSEMKHSFLPIWCLFPYTWWSFMLTQNKHVIIAILCTAIFHYLKCTLLTSKTYILTTCIYAKEECWDYTFISKTCTHTWELLCKISCLPTY